jgi:hypothetical protein
LKSGQQARFPQLWISLTEFGRATARQPMWPGSWNRRVGPVALPLRKQVALRLCWLFLQPNNSQGSNCQIGNTRTFNASVIPVLGIPAKRQAGPFKAEILTCSTCFIRCRSGSVLLVLCFAGTEIEASWAERDDTANTAIIGYAHDDNSRLIGAVDPSRLLLYCQQIAM